MTNLNIYVYSIFSYMYYNEPINAFHNLNLILIHKTISLFSIHFLIVWKIWFSCPDYKYIRIPMIVALKSKSC